MTTFVTRFGALNNYEKGHIEIINDKPKHYVFSNIFEVAGKSKPYEKVAVAGEPQGKRMGRIRLGRGHQALLPKGAAYRFSAGQPSVMIQQTIQGALTVEKWADICYR